MLHWSSVLCSQSSNARSKPEKLRGAKARDVEMAKVFKLRGESGSGVRDDVENGER